METDRKWVIVRIDGKIAAVSTDYRMLASVSAALAQGKKPKPDIRNATVYGEISAVTASFEEVWKLRQEAKWEDFMLFGTDFRRKVWRKLWELTHNEDTDNAGPAVQGTEGLICYSDFAELCQNRAGVRAVAHAIGLNPLAVVIPCHLVIPKESIDKIRNIHEKAEATIFKGDDLCINSILSDSSIDFGEYSLGRELKRKLILKELTERQ
ncbi:MAG: MGMT family protein [Bacteroidales bacterium]|nr:MGMT family protein [Bacteroidales bacterium]